MPTLQDAIVQNKVVRTVILLAIIVPVSAYLGSGPIRRGILYYLEIFAPSVVLAAAVGLWTWSWKLFGSVLATCVLLTAAVQILIGLFR